MIVDYAVTVVVDGAGVSTEQLDYLTLQSNRVETSYREVAEKVQDVATEAPRNEEAAVEEQEKEEQGESGKMMLDGPHRSPSC